MFSLDPKSFMQSTSLRPKFKSFFSIVALYQMPIPINPISNYLSF
jgi:hypothetical protein